MSRRTRLRGVTWGGHEQASIENLPAKVPGKHRWVASVGFTLTDSQVRTASHPSQIRLPDRQHLVYFDVACWDCEQPFASAYPTCLGES